MFTYRQRDGKHFFHLLIKWLLPLALFDTCLPTYPQVATNDQVFEVAAIKPVNRDAVHHFDPKHFGAQVTPSGASYSSMTVGQLIAHAYGLRISQVTGPRWSTEDRFDIDAKFPAGISKPDEPQMLQALLKDRFKLTFHSEKRQLDGYALVLAQQNGALKPSEADQVRLPISSSSSNDNSLSKGSSESPTTPGKGTQTVKFDPEKNAQHWELSKISMDDLAPRLSYCIDGTYHKVVDATNRKGTYEVVYDCPIPTRQVPTGDDAVATPSEPQGSYLLTRSLAASGLKLEKRKVLMDVYVIDHVEQPSAN